MSSEVWIPEGIPLDRSSAARIYDFLLGGGHNFEADRRIAARMLEVYPEMRLAVQLNRAFLRRAVHFLVEQGIEQILDLGSGIPTVGNVHQVAQAANPVTRVVYVDIDPVAVAYSKAMLKGNARATAIRADLRYPEAILSCGDLKARRTFTWTSRSDRLCLPGARASKRALESWQRRFDLPGGLMVNWARRARSDRAY